MFIFLFSIFIQASPLYDALLYQDTTPLQEYNDLERSTYWIALANINPQDKRLYLDISSTSIKAQRLQAQSFLLAKPEIPYMLNLYSQSTDAQVQASLLLAIAKHGDCDVLPHLHDALLYSHPLRLPTQTESALYGIGILADAQQCDFTKEVDIIIPMLHSFSTKRRKAAAFALSIIQPDWSNPQIIWDATIQEPNPRVRAWLISAAKNTIPPESIELQWFSDPDINVRMEAIKTKPESPFVVELLKDQELWVQLETIRALGKRGEDLRRIIEAGASVDAEEKSIMTNSRRFAQSLIAIEVSANPSKTTASKYPTDIRTKSVSKIMDRKKIKTLLRDKEPEVRVQAARQHLKIHPENLDELMMLLENEHIEVIRVALEHIAKTKEAALEESIWSILQQDTPAIISPALQALSSFTPLKKKEEAASILTPLFDINNAHILLSLHRLAHLLSIDAPPFPWPENLANNTHVNIDTEYGRIQLELFVEEAPITCWQWITQIERINYRPTIINGNQRYIQLSLTESMVDIGERNVRSIVAGSIVFDPHSDSKQLWIAMEEHPEDIGSYVVLGQIHQGIEILRQLRIQERTKKISIAQSSTP